MNEDRTKDAEETQMNNRYWTPGPWVADGNFVKRYWAEGEDDLGGVTKICPVWPANGDQECNAHLIACAPELFEALERLVETLDGRRESELWQAEVGQARAALAKALGGPDA